MLLRVASVLFFFNFSVTLVLGGYRYNITFTSRLVRESNNGGSYKECLNRLYKEAQFIVHSSDNDTNEVTLRTNSDFGSSISVNAFVDFENDQVKQLRVPPEIEQWQIDIIRAIIGPFQIPKFKNSNGEFWDMEDSITGHCSTHFTVSNTDDTMKIERKRDYSNCTKSSVYHRGFFGKSDLDILFKQNKVFTRKSKSTTTFKKYSSGKHYLVSAWVVSQFSINMDGYSLKALNGFHIQYDRFTLLDMSDELPVNFISLPGLSYDANREENPKTHQEKHPYSISIVIELTRRIAKDFALAGNGHEVDITKTLNKFADLVEVIKNMNLDILIKTGRVLMKNKSEVYVFKRAVGMAGTLEALQMMAWFLEKGILAPTDVDLILELPNRCETVNKKYLVTFYLEIVEKTKGIDMFENDAIIALSNLIRRYSEENPSSVEAAMIRKYGLEFMSHIVEEALEKTYGSEKFQVYTQALGNLGDAEVFERFLKEIYHSRDAFQKIMTIKSMDKIVELNPKQAQKILLTLWKDSPDENVNVRLAVLDQLLKTDLDVDNILNILNGTKSSSQDLYFHLAVEKNIMSNQFGYHMNDKIRNMIDHKDAIDKCDNSLLCPGVNHFVTQYHGEEDDLYTFLLETFMSDMGVPLYASLSVNKSRHGFGNWLKISGMLNDIGKLLNEGATSNSTTSGNIVLDYNWNQYFIPFQNVTMSTIKRPFEEWLDLIDQDHLLILNTVSSNAMSFSLLMENGFRFEYNYNEPRYFHLNITKQINENVLNVHVIRSKLQRIKAGIINPFDDLHCSFENDYKTHVNIPLSVDLSVGEQIIIRPLFAEGKQTILHFSNRPRFVEKSIHPIIPLSVEDETADDSARHKKSEDDEFSFHEINGFRVEMKNFDTCSFALDEILNLKFGGPFRYYPSSHSVFNLNFEQDLKTPTSLVISLGTRKEPIKYIGEQQEEYGDIKGPFAFNGSRETGQGILFTGNTNLSLSFTGIALNENVSSSATEILEGVLSYEKNGETQAKFSVALADRKIRTPDSNKTLLYTHVKYESSKNESSLISIQSNLDESQSNIDENDAKEYLKFTMDFQNVGVEVESVLCQLEGDYHDRFFTSPGYYHLVLKDNEKCRKAEKSHSLKEEAAVDNSTQI